MDPQHAWQATLGQLQMEMSKAAFDTWVKNADLVTHQENQFTVGVPNTYARDWLDSRLSSTVTRLLTGLMDCPQQVSFVVWNWENDEEITDFNPGEEKSTPLTSITANPTLKFSLHFR